MAIGPTNQRDQILTAVAIVAVALAGAFWYFVYDPKTLEVDALASRVDSLDQSNQRARSDVAKGTGTQIRSETAQLKENLSAMRNLVPATNEVPTLIEQVSTAARHAHIDVASVEPEPVIEGEIFDTYRYKMKLNGAYHDIADVLTRIASLGRIVAPINLSLALPQGQQKASPGRQALTSAFEIQTYAVRTGPPAPKDAKAATKAAGGTP